jgi:hypothetical protein
MDKLLLTAFLTALAGFITFVLSIVKLVNEKESTTTEYRQVWTNSVRACLASLVAKLNAIASNISGHKKVIAARSSIGTPEELGADEHKRALDFMEGSLKSSADARRQLRKEIYEAYALVRLHFKPNDVSFSRIEHKFDTVMPLIDELEDETEPEKIATIKGKIHAEVNDITGYCRDILKTEWEAVKRGEPTYEQTKRYSIYGGIGTLFVLGAIGLYAAIVAIRGDQPLAALGGAVAAPNGALPPGAAAMGIVEQQRRSLNCPSIEVNVSNSNQAPTTKPATASGVAVVKRSACEPAAAKQIVN